ncbi:hypothetical protein B0H13DRAFT_760325 [Mycena leptocephala]|nr:hypothetical protein B0H13DRAFT_760325 [Mycena leptocephala]
MQSAWSRIPPEIAHEIAGHNTDDIATLRAMSLVSKTTRSLAIVHLFSAIHFACAEDFPRWLDMLSRTPTLGTVVKKVKLSEAGKDWLRRRRGLTSATQLRHFTGPPVIPPLPRVHTVKWEQISLNGAIAMMVAHMALFPNIEKLHLRNVDLGCFARLTNLLAACGRVKSLSFHSATLEEDSDLEEDYTSDVDIDSGDESPTDLNLLDALENDERRRPERPRETLFDLTALEELEVIDCSYGNDYLPLLMQGSRPNQLKKLSFGDFCREGPCSVLGTEKLLRLGATSLVHLVIDPAFSFTGE